MESLALHTLAHIASLVSTSDLKNLRATNRLWRDVIKDAPVALRLHSTVDIGGLCEVGRAFPWATSLDLTGCPQLKNPELAHLSRLFYRLAALSLRRIRLHESPLAQLPCLESLSMHLCLCFSMMGSIREMGSLRTLTLTGCEMASLPEGLSSLSLLESLSLITSPRLGAIPDAILAGLKQLKLLDLTCCTLVTSLPNSIMGLTQLKVLKLSGCRSLVGLSENIGALSQLELLDLAGCGSLTRLPYSIGGLSQLKVIFWTCTP